MATAVEDRKGSAVESSIDRHLAETCRRIRLFDLGANLLLLGSAFCAYALAFAIFDLATGGSDAGWTLAVRWLAYILFVALAAVLGVQVLRRLTWRVNPYYAARRLEETVPEAKNSIISWLDLRNENLPPALRKTLGGKAARDLGEADPEHAIDRKPTWVLSGVFAALLLGVLVLLAAKPGQFFSLMGRAFLPFHGRQLASATHITLVRPEAGDAVVTEKQPVMIIAQVEGRVPAVNEPGAPALLYRYQPGDKFVVQPLQQDPNGHWMTRLLPDQVGSTGFWYKVAAGDAETPIYQISVRSQPLVQRYEITYQYRPYLNLPAEKVVFPNQHAALPFIKRHRGTEVTLVVRTNRTLRQGGVLLATGKSKKDLPTAVLKDDPQAFRSQWTLEQSGDFSVSFTSTEGENYTTRVPFPVDVLVDTTPTVTLTHPRENVERPANGTLEVEGIADDDFGIKEVAMQFELVDGGRTVPLKSQPYRAGATLDLDGKGMYPVHLDYLDVIRLDKLRSVQDQPLELKPGAVVKYWLEATDNSDYPNKGGNVGKSLPYEIEIQPPQDEAKQQKEREQAENRKKKHDKQQDQKLADEKQKREQEKAAEQPSSPQAKADKMQEDLKNNVNDFNQRSPSPDRGEAKGSDPDRSENKAGNGDGTEPSPDTKPKDDKPGTADQVGGSKGAPQAGGADSKPAEAKDTGASPDGGNQNNQPGAGQPQADPMKGNSKSAPKDSAGQGKNAGAEKSAGEKNAQAKEGSPDAKAPSQTPQAKGADSGDGAPSAQSKPGAAPPNTPPVNQSPQGVAKAEEATGPKSISDKKGPDTDKKSFDPRVKDMGEKGPGEAVGSGTANTKDAPKDRAKDDPGVARGAEPATKPATETARNREPTPQDVEQLKDLMQRKDGLSDWAAKTLSQMSKEAPDPNVRELAKEALAQAGRKVEPGDGSQGAGEPQTAASNPPDGPKANPNQANAKTGKPGPETKSGQVPDPSAKGDGKESKGFGGSNPQPAAGVGDEGKGDPARKDLSRFGGNLQIEDFIKRATPAYRAQAGISDEEWQSFLTKAAKYDELLRKLQRQTKNKLPADRGTPGALRGVGPTQVQAVPGADDPLEAGRGEVPPELLDAQQRFNRQGPKQ
jgi:hypothetical protein